MSTQKWSKLNQLQRLMPHKGLITSRHLKEHGISSELIQKYVKSHWLERVGAGVFKSPNEKVTWEGALSAIQKQLHIPIHVGAKTSLELKGQAHYVRLGKGGTLFLFGFRGEKKLPKWFIDNHWGYSFHITYNNLFFKDPGQSLSQIKIDSGNLIVSSPERAALEMLYLVPSKQTWGEVDLIFEHLVTLRKDHVQSLLENCNSIKVKRLFLYFSEKYNLPYFKKLNLSKINLGHGKREIIKNGRLDQKYLITVGEAS